MELMTLMPRASEAVTRVVLGVAPESLDGPTPCPEFDVRRLVSHLVEWTSERSLCAATKAAVQPVDETYDATATPGWAQAYAVRSAEAAAAWADPAAWAGETSLSGKGVMPAAFTGGVVFGEWLLHGWDLAVATGQRFDLDEELVEVLYERIASMADQAREYKVFGPEAHVPVTAPLFDRALGLAGRDPAWRVA